VSPFQAVELSTIEKGCTNHGYRLYLQGPYILVGHSLGRFNVRLFAHEYPPETAGLVLVAAGNETDNTGMLPEYRLIEESNKRTYRAFITLSRFGLTHLAAATGLRAAFAPFAVLRDAALAGAP
jgi:pimeloyl-ACP methyl ester carboxylesterase